MYLFDQQDSDLRITGAYKTHPQAKTMYVRLKDSRYMHRAIMERVLGRKLERTEKVDHINGNGLDNRRKI